MKKIMYGHVFTNSHTGNKCLFESTKDGIVRYYACRMKILEGYYKVKINSKGIVVKCWRQRPRSITSLEIDRDFRKLDKKFANL